MSSEKVVSKRMAQKEGKYKMYKGKPPFAWDRYFKWILKMILQVFIFSWIYHVNINTVRVEYNNNPVMEFFAIICWLFLTDFMVGIMVWAIKMILLYKLSYIPSDKKNNNAGLWLWEYLIYSGLRALCYVIMLTSLLVTLYSRVMLEFFAFVLAWITVSISCRVIATVSSIAITY